MADLEQKVSTHYTSADLLQTIKGGLIAAGADPEAPRPEDLKGVDEFHLGGLEATEQFLDPLGIAPDTRVLDVGSGIGGTARFITGRYRASVTGVDLTPAFVETAIKLSAMVGLDHQNTFHQGSALALPLADGSVDLATMLHVGMNVADKQALFAEVKRVLVPGGRFALFDLMARDGQPFDFPVPWASNAEGSFVVPPQAYRDAAASAGLALATEVDRTEYGIGFFKRVMAMEGGPPPVGLHLIMGPTAQEKYGNAAKAVLEGRIAPWEMVFAKT